MKQNDRVEFGCENCDMYIIPFEKIIYFKINGLDYKDFLNRGILYINSYDLALKEPIIVKDDLSKYIPYDLYYNFRDFTDISIFINNKKFELSNAWIGESEYATLGQNAYKDKEGIYHLTFDRHYKPSYFNTLEMENFVRYIYNLPASKEITDDFIEKIEEIFIDKYFFEELYDNHYFDLGKFKNLKRISFDYEFEINYSQLALNCPNLEEIDLDKYYPLDKKELKNLKLLKELKIIRIQDGNYILTKDGFKFIEMEEEIRDYNRTEKEEIIERIDSEYDSALDKLKQDFDYEFIDENEYATRKMDIENKYLEFKEKYKF